MPAKRKTAAAKKAPSKAKKEVVAAAPAEPEKPDTSAIERLQLEIAEIVDGTSSSVEAVTIPLATLRAWKSLSYNKLPSEDFRSLEYVPISQR